MKYLIRTACVIISVAFTALYATGQPLPCPPINTTYSTATGDTTICNGSCAPIHMTGGTSLKSTSTYVISSIPYLPQPYNQGTSVVVGQDDIYSGVVAIPFPFCFFGTKYNSCVIGANGQICFNTNLANGSCAYQVSPLPGGNLNSTINCIMGPNHDMYPPAGGTVKWQVYGTAPCRTFVVSWYQLPIYLPPNNCGVATQQIVLYESTYAIDIFIENMPLCSVSTSSGAAHLGIEDASGTNFIMVPGRNGTVWSATNEGWRFTPDGPPGWTFTCYDKSNPGVPLTSQYIPGDTATASLIVCPTQTTDYLIKAVASSSCDSLILWDSVHVKTANASPLDTFFATNPTGCGFTDGYITFYGVNPDSSFVVTYTANNVPGGPVTVTATHSGQFTLTGLPADTISNIMITTLLGCPAGPFGPVILTPPFWQLDSAHVTEPTQCGLNDGYITIYPGTYPNKLNPGDAVTVNYYKDNVQQPPFPTTVNPQGVIILANLTSGIYDSLSVTHNGCTTPLVGQYILNDPPFLSAFDYGIHLGCNGDTVIFKNNSGNGITYTWDFGDASSSTDVDPTHVYATQGVYTVTLHTFNGTCEKTSTHEITLVHPVISSFTAIRDSICEHQTVNFDGSPSTNAYKYVWDFGDGKYDSTNKVSVAHTYNIPGAYTAALTVYDFVPCPDKSTHTILVSPFEIHTLYPDTSVCIYKPMTIVDTLAIEPYVSRPLTFAWSPADFLDSPDIQQPHFYAADSQWHTYTVTMTSAAPFNCTTSEVIQIYAQPHVHLSNVTKDLTITYGQSVHLNVDGAYYVEWVPALYLDNAHIKDPISTPTEPIIYTAYGMNAYGGCRDTAYIKIDLTYDNEFVPSAFTPNGDGKNDVFKITNMRAGQKLLEFRVYDRWGQKVFETNDVTKGWDGTFNGQAMDAAVFKYMIRVSLPDGTQRVHQGDVTLLR